MSGIQAHKPPPVLSSFIILYGKHHLKTLAEPVRDHIQSQIPQ